MTTMPVNRRSTQRKPLINPITLKVNNGAGEATHDAQIIDRSKYGLRVRTHGDMTAGEIVECIDLGGLDHPVKCLVKWTGARGTDLEGQAGLEFISPEATPK